MTRISFSPLARLRGKGLKDRLMHPYDAWWDWRLDGINTFGYAAAVGSIDDPGWQGHYKPVSYRDILAILRHVGIGADDVFVDLGCGLGRAVFAASWLGAKRSVGVEIDKNLFAKCNENATRGRHADGKVDFACVPAETYLQSDTTIVFMFHPFGAGTMGSVVELLDSELDQRRRSLKLIYMNPVFDHVLQASRHLKRVEQWSPHFNRFTNSGRYAVSFYESNGANP